MLEDHLPKSRYTSPAARVVHGQRMMQAASDIYLGWTKGVQEGRYLYWRQLRDMKGSADVETMPPFGLAFYARQCGWTLARAHARSGDPIAIAAYLGKSDEFDQAIADFSERYADQNERDYEAFIEAIRSGRLDGGRGRLTAVTSGLQPGGSAGVMQILIPLAPAASPHAGAALVRRGSRSRGPAATRALRQRRMV